MMPPVARALVLAAVLLLPDAATAPDILPMDTPTSVLLVAGECKVFRVAVTGVHAAENRGLLLSYRSTAVRPTAGYVAYGLPAQHTDGGGAVDTGPTALGVSESGGSASGCWADAASAAFPGSASGVVFDLAALPGVAGVSAVLPHDVPTADAPESCELVAGDYYVYVKNGGASAVELSLRASIELEAAGLCAGLSGSGATDEYWWSKTLLISLSVVGFCLLGLAFVWYCVCTTAEQYPHPDGEDEESQTAEGAEQLAAMRQQEHERVQKVRSMEREGMALFSGGYITSAAERFAAAAVLEPEGSEKRAELEERLVLMLEKEKQISERVYTLEDKRRPDRYYDDSVQSGSDDEVEVAGGADALSVDAARAKAAAQMSAVGAQRQASLKSGAGRRQEQAARAARLQGDGSRGGGFNRTGTETSSPQRP